MAPMRFSSLAFLTSVVLGGACTPTETKHGDGGTRDANVPEADAGAAEAGTAEAGAGEDACVGAACSGACSPACTAEAPVCADGECSRCTGDGDCSGFGDARRCVEGACVACAEHADCTDPGAPACDPVSHTCGSCTESASGPDEACAHFADKPVCSAGACVECAAGKDAACGASVCDAQAKTCDVTRGKRSKTVCNACVADAAACTAGAACVSDGECQVGQACVADKAGGGGRVCLTVATSDELCVRPFFSKSAAQASASGESVVVCTYATSTTCQAQADWRQKRCGTARVDNADLDVDGSGDDTKCGVDGLDDGLCVRYLSRYLCTVPCRNSPEDCPRDANACATLQPSNRSACTLD